MPHDAGLKLILSAFFVLFCAACAGEEQANGVSEATVSLPRVETEAGLIEGNPEGDYIAFKGIPFAEAPVGKLRWTPPQPVDSWLGVKETKAFAPICMQTPYDSDPEDMPDPSEDCLYLNVWAPAKAPEKPLPVMVWIHGGGFVAGSASHPIYEPKALLDKGIIFVSTAYRLGTFGFLAHPELSAESEDGISGNYGLLDQIAALHWVQENIAAFGGDPDNVTIFGESAGGMSVGMLMASPKAEGLFQKAIAESGAFMALPESSPETVQANGAFTLSAAEAHGEAALAMLKVSDIETARQLSPEDILKAQGGYWPEWDFQPTLDGKVLPLDPRGSFETGVTAQIPLLLGTNTDEGAMFFKAATPEAFEGMVRAQYGAGGDTILAAYPHVDDEEALAASQALFRDGVFGWPAWRMGLAQAKSGGEPVYMYSFDQHLPVPESALMYSATGSSHASELGYVFGSLASPVFGVPIEVPDYDDSDEALSELMQSYWVNFAKTGDPNGAGLPEWTAFSEDAQNVMKFSDVSEMTPLPYAEELAVLEAYFEGRRTAD